MNTMKKRLLAGIGAALLAVGVAVATPAAAGAVTYSSSCKGTHIRTATVTNVNGTVLGRFGIYRDGNYACAVLVKAGPVYGVPTITRLYVQGHERGSDEGTFRYQTAAIRVYAPAHKVQVGGTVQGKNGALNYTGVNVSW